MQETWVRSLGREDPLEKEMATHCSVLAWRIPWTEEPGGLQSTGSQGVRHDWAASIHFCNSVTLWVIRPPIGGFLWQEGRSVSKDSKSLPEFQI